MTIPDSFLDELRSRLPVSEIVGSVLSLRREGREFRAVEDHSLTVNDDKRLWWDHAKDEGGDIFAFMVKHQGMDFRAAVERCAEIAHLPVPDDRRPNGHHGPRRPNSDGPEEPPPWEPDADLAGAASGVPTASAREITATYPYTSGQGELMYEVVRLAWTEDGRQKKTFLQRRPAPETGKWIWGLAAGDYLRARNGDWYQATKGRLAKWAGAEKRAFDACEHGLYRLVELREEMSPDRPVYLVEGEKDADTLWGWGLPATTNSGGAANWRPEHAEVFRGQDVVIPIDNDDAGRRRGEKVAQSLQRVAKRVRVLDFAAVWDGAPKGTDVTDWKRLREGTAEELAEIVDGLPEWRPAPFASEFGAVTWGEPRAIGRPYEYAIKGIIPRREAVLIYGASQSGKSFKTMSMAMAIARGVPYFGRRVRQGLVIYCAAEAGSGFADLRMPAYAAGHGIDLAARLPFVCLTRKFDLFGGDEQLVKLIAEIKHHRDRFDVPLEAVVIDTLNKTTPGMDEIHGKDVGIVINRLDRIREECDCGLWLVHHMNAGGERPRGHTSLYAAFETAIKITRSDSEKDADGRPVRIARLEKQREGEDGVSWKFVLPAVEIGKDPDGDAITSCVVKEPAGMSQSAGAAKDSAGIRFSDQQNNVLRALVNALEEFGEPTPTSLNLPRSVARVVKVQHWYEVYRRTASEDNDAAVRQAMKRANDKFLDRRVMGRINPYVWITGRPVLGVISGPKAPSPLPNEAPPDEPLPWDAGELQ
jgi:hypothetical protein